MNKTGIFIFIIAGLVLTQQSMTLYIPALPLLSDFFKTPEQSIMLTITITFIGYTIGQLFWGNLSDQIGRRPSLIIALIIFIIAQISSGTSQHFLQFAVSFLFIGFAIASFTSIGNAMVRDVFPPHQAQKIMGYNSIAMGISPSLAPLFGSHLISAFGWHSLFISLTSYATLLLLALVFIIKETHQDIKSVTHTNAISTSLSLFKNNYYFASIAALGLVFGAYFSYLNSSAFIFVKYLHVSIENFGWLSLIIGIPYISGAIYFSMSIKRKSATSLLNSGLVISTLGVLITTVSQLITTHSIYAYVTTLLMTAFGIGITMPAAKACAMTSFNSNHGAAASIMKFTQTAITTIATAVTAFILPHTGPLGLTLLMMTLIITALAIFKRLRYDKSPTTDPLLT